MYIHSSLRTTLTTHDAATTGHESLVRALRVVAHSNSAGHSFLMVGIDPDATHELAQWFAALSICTEAGDEPCGTCAACRSVTRGDQQHALTLPTSERGLYSVESVRSLRAQLQLTASSSGRRVVLIEHAEGLHPSAANALLKVLEEPHPNTRFILTTSHATNVLRTIRSRAVLVMVQPVALTTMREVLQRTGAPEKVIEIVLQHAPGQLARATRILGDASRLSALQESSRLALRAGSGGLPERLALASSVLPTPADGSEARQRLQQFFTSYAAVQPHQHTQHLLAACQHLRTNATPRLLLDSFLVASL